MVKSIDKMSDYCGIFLLSEDTLMITFSTGKVTIIKIEKKKLFQCLFFGKELRKSNFCTSHDLIILFRLTSNLEELVLFVEVI